MYIWVTDILCKMCPLQKESQLPTNASLLRTIYHFATIITFLWALKIMLSIWHNLSKFYKLFWYIHWRHNMSAWASHLYSGTQCFLPSSKSNKGDHILKVIHPWDPPLVINLSCLKLIYLHVLTARLLHSFRLITELKCLEISTNLGTKQDV